MTGALHGLRVVAVLLGAGVLPPAAAARTWSPPSVSLPRCLPAGISYTVTTYAVDAETGRRLSAAELDSERVGLEYVVDGEVAAATRDSDSFRWTFEAGPRPRAVTVIPRLVSREGPIEGEARRVQVVPDTRLLLPPSIGFGPVRSGCGAEEHCRPLDLSGSVGLVEGVLLAFRRAAGEGGPGWDDLGVRVRQGGESHDLDRGDEVVLPYGPHRPIEVCYAAPWCEDPPAPAEERLVVTARSDCLDEIDRQCRDAARGGCVDRSATTILSAEVTPNGFLDCFFWWIVAAIGTVILALVAWGFLSPSSFSQAATVRVSNSERALLRDPGRPLRTVPHGRRGFYRSATCSFSSEGITVPGSKPHVLQLRAEPGNQIRLCPRGAVVERMERRKWVRVDTPAGPGAVPETHVRSGVAYRVNQTFFFQVDS